VNLDNLLPPVLTLAAGAVGWFLKSKIEAARAVEDRLRQDRIKVYAEILEPVLAPFTESDFKARHVAQRPSPTVLKKAGFQLALMGSDPVVTAWNTLMRHLYKADPNDNAAGSASLKLLGHLLLEIRRSIGNQRTRLDDWDMLTWLLKDIESHRADVEGYS